MRIEYRKEGGIAHLPGLAKPLTIDTAELTPEQAAELERLVEQSAFFSLPATVGRLKRGAADYQEYHIQVTEGDRSHAVQVVDPAGAEAVAALIDFLDDRQREAIIKSRAARQRGEP
ncbi:MAG: hypothetical protein KIT09_24350 [Bryobacteraceae bacterium]|nr:hypothetical protein [Bryobacteraceae bacterium]